MKRAFLITGISALAFLLSVESVEIVYVTWILLFAAAVCLISVAVRFIFGSRKTLDNTRYPRFKSVFEILIASSLSICLCGTVYVYKVYNYNSVIYQYNGCTVECVLQKVSEEQYSDEGYCYFEAKPVSGIDTKGYNVKIFTDGFPSVEIYDKISGSFTFLENGKAYKIQGLSTGVVLVSFSNDFIVEPVSEKPFWFNIIELRRFIKNASISTVGKSHGFIKALLLGDRTDMSRDEFNSLKNSGLLHVTAVSGLHAGIAASFVLALFSFVKNRWVKYTATFVVLLFLAAVTGFSPSVIRAVFMMSATFAGALMLRRTDSLNLLGAILTGCLVVSPFAAYSASLLLSFSATAGLILFAKPLQIAITTWWFKFTGKYVSKFFSGVIATFSVSLSCSVFSIPVSMALFNSFSAAGLISNLLCLWLIKYIFILSSVTISLSAFSFLEPFFNVVSLVVNWSVNYIMKISALFSDTFLSELKVDPVTIIISALIGFFVYLFMGKRFANKNSNKSNKQVGRVSLAVIISLAVLISTAVAEKLVTSYDNKLHTVFVDVGQGSGAYICMNGKAIIFDCGGSKSAGDAINESLYEHGVKEIDCIVISHLHEDHANGMKDIFDEWEIDEVIIPDTEKEPEFLTELMTLALAEGSEILEISEDLTRKLGEVEIELLTNHFDPESSDPNENCIVSVVSYSDFSVMFTGDLTSWAEGRLVDNYGSALKSTVFTVPHHGSKDSSSDSFLAMVSPEVSVISVGLNNYGFPSDGTLEKLLKYGEIFTTQVSGDIEFITDGTEINRK